MSWTRRFIHRSRWTVAFLLLFSGQLGTVATAQSLTCKRGPAPSLVRGLPLETPPAVHETADAAQPASELPHTHSPGPGHPAVVSSGCASATALPVGRYTLAPRSAASGRSYPPACLLPGDLFASSHFRPPRL